MKIALRRHALLLSLPLALLFTACGPREKGSAQGPVPDTAVQVIRNTIAKTKPKGCSVESLDCRLEKQELDRLWIVAQTTFDCDFKEGLKSLDLFYLCRVKIYASNRETNVIRCDCIPYDGLRITPEHYERLEELARP